MVISKHFVLFWNWGAHTSFFSGWEFSPHPALPQGRAAHSVFHPPMGTSPFPQGCAQEGGGHRAAENIPGDPDGWGLGWDICWSPHGLGLGNFGVIYRINGIPWDAGVLEVLPWLYLPFPHFLISYCLSTASSVFPNQESAPITLRTPYKALTSHTLMFSHQ